LITAEAAGSTASNNYISRAGKNREGSNIHMTQYIGQSSKVTKVQWEFQKSSQIHYSMQAVYIDVNKKNTSRRTNIVGTIICAGGIGRHLEGKDAGGELKGKITGI